MDDKSNRHADYVSRVHDDTQRLVRDMLGENEKLRALAATAERENEFLRSRVESLSHEIDRHEKERLALRRQLDDLERNSSRYLDDVAAIEQRSANLANLYVSSYQLHGTLDREAVLAAIREIVINLIGSEELGVFETAEDGSLNLVTSFGIEETHHKHISPSHPIGRLVAEGEIFVAGQSPVKGDVPPVVACVPLKLDGRVTGSIVVFSLLPHKSSLQELDFELFDLLATHAATALYCTALHARLTAAV
jgi:GAF domain-containing protein